jgi:hypothetical protein
MEYIGGRPHRSDLNARHSSPEKENPFRRLMLCYSVPLTKTLNQNFPRDIEWRAMAAPSKIKW